MPLGLCRVGRRTFVPLLVAPRMSSSSAPQTCVPSSTMKVPDVVFSKETKHRASSRAREVFTLAKRRVTKVESWSVLDRVEADDIRCMTKKSLCLFLNALTRTPSKALEKKENLLGYCLQRASELLSGHKLTSQQVTMLVCGSSKVLHRLREGTDRRGAKQRKLFNDRWDSEWGPLRMRKDPNPTAEKKVDFTKDKELDLWRFVLPSSLPEALQLNLELSAWRIPQFRAAKVKPREVSGLVNVYSFHRSPATPYLFRGPLREFGLHVAKRMGVEDLVKVMGGYARTGLRDKDLAAACLKRAVDLRGKLDAPSLATLLNSYSKLGLFSLVYSPPLPLAAEREGLEESDGSDSDLSAEEEGEWAAEDLGVEDLFSSEPQRASVVSIESLCECIPDVLAKSEAHHVTALIHGLGHLPSGMREGLQLVVSSLEAKWCSLISSDRVKLHSIVAGAASLARLPGDHSVTATLIDAYEGKEAAMTDGKEGVGGLTDAQLSTFSLAMVDLGLKEDASLWDRMLKDLGRRFDLARRDGAIPDALQHTAANVCLALATVRVPFLLPWKSEEQEAGGVHVLGGASLSAAEVQGPAAYTLAESFYVLAGLRGGTGAPPSGLKEILRKASSSLLSSAAMESWELQEQQKLEMVGKLREVVQME